MRGLRPSWQPAYRRQLRPRGRKYSAKHWYTIGYEGGSRAAHVSQAQKSPLAATPPRCSALAYSAKLHEPRGTVTSCEWHDQRLWNEPGSAYPEAGAIGPARLRANIWSPSPPAKVLDTSNPGNIREAGSYTSPARAWQAVQTSQTRLKLRLLITFSGLRCAIIHLRSFFSPPPSQVRPCTKNAGEIGRDHHEGG